MRTKQWTSEVLAMRHVMKQLACCRTGSPCVLLCFEVRCGLKPKAGASKRPRRERGCIDFDTAGKRISRSVRSERFYKAAVVQCITCSILSGVCSVWCVGLWPSFSRVEGNACILILTAVLLLSVFRASAGEHGLRPVHAFIVNCIIV